MFPIKILTFWSLIKSNLQHHMVKFWTKSSLMPNNLSFKKDKGIYNLPITFEIGFLNLHVLQC